MRWFKRSAPTLLLFVLATTIPCRAQNPDRAKMIAAARDIMRAARYCTLVTIDSAGRANTRTMDPFLPEDDMVVWFATNPSSRKVKEIRRNRLVTIHCFDPKAEDYFSLRGTARLVNDPKEKARRWKDDWKTFYPDRTTHYLLIEVRPLRLEVVSPAKGILGDPNNWAPPTINFKRL
jgi:general stress protein 26